MTITDRPCADAVADFAARATRIDAAQKAVERLDAEAREAAHELENAIQDHYGSVLRTMASSMRSDEAGRELLYRLVDDPEVYAALAKAGVVKPSLAMQAVLVLDGVRPYLTSHNGDVELVRIEDGVAHVRLLGACQGCGSSTEALRDSVAAALLDNIPELHEVRDVPPDTAPTALIPVDSIGRKPQRRPGPG